MEICGRDGRSSRRGSNKRMECKGRPKWRDAPLTKKAPYKPNWARTDLCGGREVTRVPTAKVARSGQTDAFDPIPEAGPEEWCVRACLIPSTYRRRKSNGSDASRVNKAVRGDVVDLAARSTYIH